MPKAKSLSLLALAPLAMALPLAAQAKDPPRKDEGPKFSVMEFVIVTGSDDLRGNSTAWVVIDPPSHHGRSCPLKVLNQDSWGNGSTHTIPCELPEPLTLRQLTHTGITLNYVGSNGDTFSTQDNWNVNRVTIYVYKPGPRLCLFMASGNPLHRFQGLHNTGFGQGANDSIVVTDFPNKC